MSAHRASPLVPITGWIRPRSAVTSTSGATRGGCRSRPRPGTCLGVMATSLRPAELHHHLEPKRNLAVRAGQGMLGAGSVRNVSPGPPAWSRRSDREVTDDLAVTRAVAGVGAGRQWCTANRASARGYGSTRFLSDDTPRNGQQAAAAAMPARSWTRSASGMPSWPASTGAVGRHNRRVVAGPVQGPGLGQRVPHRQPGRQRDATTAAGRTHLVVPVLLHYRARARPQPSRAPARGLRPGSEVPAPARARPGSRQCLPISAARRRRSPGRTGTRSARRGRSTRPAAARLPCRCWCAAAGSRTW
jgi:hypothetical protein